MLKPQHKQAWKNTVRHFLNMTLRDMSTSSEVSEMIGGMTSDLCGIWATYFLEEGTHQGSAFVQYATWAMEHNHDRLTEPEFKEYLLDSGWKLCKRHYHRVI